MRITTLRRNLLAYAASLLVAVAVAVLQENHRQISERVFDPILLWDAANVAITATLVNTLFNMKLPSVGHERVTKKVDQHEDRLEVTDPADLPPRVEGANRG